MSIQIYDNFLDNNTFRNIQDHFTSYDFPWYYNTSVIDENDLDKQNVNNGLNFQFVHTIHRFETSQSNSFFVIKPLLEQMNIFTVLRIKANLVTNSGSEIYEHGMHVDLNCPSHIKSKTATFYINSNNGYTLIEKTGQKIDSVENRLAVFDSNLRHTGSTCTDSKCRIVLNINYVPISI